MFRRLLSGRIAFATVAASLVLSACSDDSTSRLTGPVPAPSAAMAAASQQGIDAAIAAQERHTAALMRIPGVVGTAVTLLPNGRPAVEILLAQGGVAGLPADVDGVPVVQHVSGLLMARSDPTTRARPAPLGYSVGHPLITAGTIGARVVDASAHVYILSNNHVLANANNASIGDAEYQPGPYDGGTSADQVATLSAFRTIDFSAGGSNTIDAAIALTSTANVDNKTPLDDGYGQPAGTIFGDGNNDGIFDNRNALLNLAVQKYGRTTELTHGTITGINATVSICYEVVFIFCTKSATYVDQLIITPGTFSGGGDSGSLIVTDNSGLNPVALLFAGSSTETIANRIDLVLNYFGVRVDAANSPPPTPVTDVAVTSVSAPASTTQGNTVSVSVTMQNVGNQNVGSSFDVTLVDETDNATIGTQSIASLAAGASATRTFNWNTTGATIASHTLRATQGLADDNAANDSKTASVNVTAPGSTSGMHVGDLDAVLVQNNGKTWAATVEITVHDANHAPLNGAAVVGSWSSGGLNANTCTTSGSGQCIVLAPSIKKNLASVTYRVTSVTASSQTYSAADNHDPDGDSNGTSIVVKKP